ncbi:MAG TPA: class A beta-lactamase [Blastococcus sp.]|jgi:beta-lactamase class A
MDRSAFLALLGTTSALAVSGTRAVAEARAGGTTRPFAVAERLGRGRLGVAAIDLRDGRFIGQRENERFALASTFKLPLVMDVLSRVDRRIERLNRAIRYGASDVLPFSPVVAAHVREGSLTVAQLCAAAIAQSDNAAANLLLRTLGGPSGVTAYLRTIGDSVTRLDRTEPALNDAPPSDPRDTTTPRAMADVLARLVREPVLSPASKALLFTWMRATETGLTRIRAGVPKGWTVGDKTGTTDTAANDVSILWPPSGAPIVLAVYVADAKAADADRDAAIAAVAGTVARSFREISVRRRGR